MARRRTTKADLVREMERLRTLLREERPLVHDLEVQREELAIESDQLIRAQRDLERSRDRYAELFDFSPMAYAAIDRNGVILELNLIGARLLAAERNRLVGLPFVTLVAPPTGEGSWTTWSRVGGRTRPSRSSSSSAPATA